MPLSPDVLETPTFDQPSQFDAAAAPAIQSAVQAQPEFRSFLDVKQQRQYAEDSLLAALRERQFENSQYQLRLADVQIKPKRITKRDEKIAAGEKGTLHQPVKGLWELVDKATGQVVDKKKGTIAYLPHMTDRGTYLVNGTNYVVNHQSRLRPGIYTRLQQNGLVEAQFNIAPRTGKGFRLRLDPESGRFKVRIQQGESNLYPLLRAIGYDDEDLRKAWGDKLFEANRTEDRNQADLKKTLSRLGVDVDELKPSELNEAAAEHINGMGIDPEVMEFLTGHPADKLNRELLLGTTTRMLGVARGDVEGDDRDSMAFQTVHGPEDFFAERITKDAGKVGRKILWKATKDGSLKRAPSSAYRDAIYSLFNGTGLAQAVEDTNPIEIADLRLKLSRMGEGGLRSTEAAPRDARGVQPSHYGLVDGLMTPESDKIGLDMRVAWNTFKGRDNKLYTATINKAGKTEIVSAPRLLKGTIGFAGELDREDPRGRVRAMVGGKMKEVPRSQVDFWIQNPEEAYAPTTNMVPFFSAARAQRTMMGARMTTQALPLVEREAPLVQSAIPGDERSFDGLLGEQAGAARAEIDGVVTKVTRSEIHIKQPNGETEVIDLYDELPMNRMTNLNQSVAVEPGQRIKKGDLLATSNFTDDNGVTAMGRNLRVGYIAHDGMTFEDATVISESAAAKLAAEVSLKFDREVGDDIHATDIKTFRGLFPNKYNQQQLKMLDDDGVIRKGQVVHPGDPLTLQVDKVRKQGIGSIMRGRRTSFRDESQEWDHNYPGQVVDVFKRKNGSAKVVVRSILPAREGDKLSGRYGDKGVISKVVPDDQMPQDSSGPLDILVSPAGISSRRNPSQVAEALYGKLAALEGKPALKRAFRQKGEGSIVENALDALERAGLKASEDITDPATDRRIKSVLTGNRYYMRLHHLADKKLSTRDTDEYTVDDTPAKGGPTGAKRLSLAETASLLSAGATEVLRDAKLVRGQRNDDYWRGIQLGYTPAMPTDSVASKKFLEQLKSAGVNVTGRGDNLYIMPLTDKDTEKLTAGRKVTKSGTFNWDTMEPIKGGLFDVGATGGNDGTMWASYDLPQPVLNPIMQEPVQKILGLTEKGLRDIIAGRKDFRGRKGITAIQAALKQVGSKLDDEIAATKQLITQGSKSKRDSAVKRLRYLESMKKMGFDPSDAVISSVPVLPPKYRPVSAVDSMTLIADPNYLYADMIGAADNLEESKEVFGDEGAADAYLDLYDSVKAVTGLGQPVSTDLREKKVRGILAQAVGLGRSPKRATFQRRIIGTSVDQVGRAVIAPDPKLDIDQIGIPKEMAWMQYRKYIVRKLVQRGMPATQAVRAVLDRTTPAEKALHEVMDERPIFINRAPTLHRHSLIGGKPVLVEGDAIKLSPPVEKGLGADHDGDAVQLHVPSTDEAVDEVYNKLMPSRNLRTPTDFGIHMLPENEFVSGIYAASQRNKEKRPRTFESEEAALRAYMRGEIALSDPIRIADA